LKDVEETTCWKIVRYDGSVRWMCSFVWFCFWKGGKEMESGFIKKMVWSGLMFGLGWAGFDLVKGLVRLNITQYL
jgi:hypothetical protein